MAQALAPDLEVPVLDSVHCALDAVAAAIDLRQPATPATA
jgi:hypothetical protein